MKRQERTRKRKSTNREFAVIAYLFLGLFLALIVYLTYFQVFKSEDIINNAYNKRQEKFAQSIIRGNILSADGKVIAETKVSSDGTETRDYPYSRMFAHVVGYCDNGKTGIESLANFNLLRSHSFILDRIKNEFSNEKNQGDDVITTLNYEVQKAAYEAMGNYQGAVVAIEPTTGKVLTMVSKPDYNPNTIAQDWDSIVNDSDNQDSVLLNRATQGSYTPGSTFKIFTTLEYIREHTSNYQDFSYTCNGSATIDGHTIHCYSGEVHGTINLKEAFAQSCNSAFSTIGVSLNKTKFRNTCENLLFNKALPIALPYTKSSFSIDKSSGTASVMQASIGQEKTTVSPMHMAMVVSAIVNQGTLMKPYFIDYTQNDQGTLVKQYEASEYGTILTKKEANILSNYMRATVEDGTATSLDTSRYTAGGKTGSAQVSDSSDDTHSWFVGYAKKNGKKIAIAVIIEKQGNGSKYAVPIAKKVFDAYFK